jgi:hypothetical protein
VSIKRNPIRVPSGEVFPCLRVSIFVSNVNGWSSKGTLPLPFQAKPKIKPDSRGLDPRMTFLLIGDTPPYRQATPFAR